MLPLGAAPLIAMRKAGQAPAGSVFVEYGDDCRNPDWHRWSDTMHSPSLVVRFADPVERLDFRCLVGLEVVLVMCRYDTKAADLFSRLQQYATEVAALSPDFDDDIGLWWVPRYGVRPFEDRRIITAYEAARATCTNASLRRDPAAYAAAQAEELRLLKEFPWLRC